MTAITMCSFDATLCRVLLSMTAVRTSLGHDSTGLVERSLDQIVWTTVRGAAAAPISATAVPVSDYEFDPDAQNFYRVTPNTGTYTDNITPTLPGAVPWLKNLRFPFLNQALKIANVDDITRTATAGVFTVMGRSRAVAISTVRAGRQTAITVETDIDDDTTDLHGLLSTGDVLLLQIPAAWTMPTLGGYYSAGDTVETRQDVPWAMRWTTIPLTEVEPPDPSVAPIQATWATLVSNYATWAAVVLAQPTWNDVMELVGAPGDVIVN